MNPSSRPTSVLARRDFIRTAAGAALIPSLAGRAAETASPAGRNAMPTCLHVFAKPLERISYADTAAMIAEAGFGGIDFTVRPKTGHILPEKVEDDLPRA